NEICSLEDRTKRQHQCDEWHLERKKRLVLSLLNLLPNDTVKISDDSVVVIKMIKIPKIKIPKKNMCYENKVIKTIATAMMELHDMGHNAIPLDQNHQIIHNLISQDSHLKKKSKKYLNQEKKKINKAIASETLRHMVEFEINILQNKYQLKMRFQYHIIPEVLFDAFLNFSDNYLFTEEHNNKIHAILNNFNMLNLTYTEEKQNPDFGKMLHGTLEQMIICSKFNIVYKYIDSFITTNKFTENAYVGNKYLYLNFLCMVHKLEKLKTEIPHLNISDNNQGIEIPEDTQNNSAGTKYIQTLFGIAEA
ncbi:Uncharacterized protein FWK35_00030237, partial [Aphis craccivora]